MNPCCDPNSTKYPDRVFIWGRWRTPEQIEKRREQQNLYGKLEKRRESLRLAGRRFSQTEKGRANYRRHEQSRIHVSVGGLRFSYRVAPEKKAELQSKLAEFRSQQRKEYQHARFDQTVA